MKLSAFYLNLLPSPPGLAIEKSFLPKSTNLDHTFSSKETNKEQVWKTRCSRVNYEIQVADFYIQFSSRYARGKFSWRMIIFIIFKSSSTRRKKIRDEEERLEIQYQDKDWKEAATILLIQTPWTTGFPAAAKPGYEQFVAFERGVEPRFTFQGCLHDTWEPHPPGNVGRRLAGHRFVTIDSLERGHSPLF